MTLQTRRRRKTLSSVSVCDSFQSLCAFSYHFDAHVQNVWVSLQWFCTSLLPLCVFLLVSVFWGLFLIFMCLSVSVWTRLISLIDLLLFVLSAGLCCHFASLFLHVCLFMFVMCLFCAFLCLFVFFVLILVNHSCCGSPCGQLLLIRLVSYHLCVSNSFAAPCCCFYVNRLFNLPAQLVIR